MSTAQDMDQRVIPRVIMESDALEWAENLIHSVNDTMLPRDPDYPSEEDTRAQQIGDSFNVSRSLNRDQVVGTVSTTGSVHEFNGTTAQSTDFVPPMNCRANSKPSRPEKIEVVHDTADYSQGNLVHHLREVYDTDVPEKPKPKGPRPQPAHIVSNWLRGACSVLDADRLERANDSSSGSAVVFEASDSDEDSATTETQNISRDPATWQGAWILAEEVMFSQFGRLDISIVSPELSSSMMSKYVVYQVRTDPLNTCVRRRYNDFVWLRSTLMARYTGLFIPALPSTQGLSASRSVRGEKTNLHSEFIRNRLSQLQMFASRLARIPFLRQDTALLAFLTIQSDRELKQFADAAALTHNYDQRNEGLELWHNILDNVPLRMNVGKQTNNTASNNTRGESEPLVSQTIATMTASASTIAAQSQSVFRDVKRRLEATRTILQGMEKECRHTGRKAMQLASAMGCLNEQTTSWLQQEGAPASLSANTTPTSTGHHSSASSVVEGTTEDSVYENPFEDSLQEYLSHYASGQNALTHSALVAPRIIGRVLLCHLQYQLASVEEFRNHLLSRESVLKELERAEKERVRLQEERANRSGKEASSTFSLFSRQTNEIESQYNRKSEQVATLQRTVARMSIALQFSELDRFHYERLQATHDLVATMAATNAELSHSLSGKWDEIARVARLDRKKYRQALEAITQTLDADAALIFSDS